MAKRDFYSFIFPLSVVLDCKVSNWSEWSVCSKTCGKGKRKRTRMIIQQPTKGGLKCPKLGERQICNAFKCHGK